jgi:hypothetical protein
MTLPEIIGGAVAAVTASVGAYRAVAAKFDSAVGKKEPGDESLRDLVMRVDGKLDAHHEVLNDRFARLEDRLVRVEARVFTPPARAAIRVAASKE